MKNYGSMILQKKREIEDELYILEQKTNKLERKLARLQEMEDKVSEHIELMNFLEELEEED